MLIPACSNKDEEAKKPQTSSQQTAKAPDEMKTILTDLEKIISELDQKVKADKTSKLQQNAKIAGQIQQGQQDQQSQQSQQQGQEQSKTSSQSQTGKQNQMSSWEKEDTSIKNIHSNWNSVEPEAIKAGLSTTDRDSFEQALEELTMAVSSQKKKESLTAAIEVYGQYTSLVRVFTMSVPAEFFQVKYETMMAVNKAMNQEWDAAQEYIPKMQQSWTNLKVQAQSKDGKSISRTEFAIQDLEQAIKSQQPDLLSIKAEIVMNNLQKMQKELSSQSSGGTSS